MARPKALPWARPRRRPLWLRTGREQQHLRRLGRVVGEFDVVDRGDLVDRAARILARAVKGQIDKADEVFGWTR